MSKNEKGAAQLTKYQTIEDNILGKTAAHHYKDDSLCDERMPWYLIASFVLTMLSLTLWFWMDAPRLHRLPAADNTPAFDSFGRYVMNNYDEAKPMADFLPALGGIWGYPMWAFFVNRGQGITAFGINNKDGGIAKFNTAEKGFRTFVKGTAGATSFQAMPFAPHFSEPTPGQKPNRTMSIAMNEMEINERDPVTHLHTSVLYFTVPEEEFACMVRRVTFTNEGTEDMELQVIDGLAKLEPSGIPNGNLDSMGRTMEAWMNVYNMGTDSDKTQPFYHASQGTADTPEIQVVKEGHFSLAYMADTAADDNIAASKRARKSKGQNEGVVEKKNVVEVKDTPHRRMPFIVDPTVLFGTDTVLTYPSEFFGVGGHSVEALLQAPQGTTSRTPCAFTGSRFKLKRGENISLVSMYGHAATLEVFTQHYAPKLMKKGYVSKKRAAAVALVDGITERVETKTSSSIFDAYTKQNFLDNVLRGGLPIQLGGDKSKDIDEYAVQRTNSISRPKIFHVYSRIHGDIERDYNNFNIDTTFFSQGPGNFRDVSQNRRSDVKHTPVVGDFDLRMFLSLVQADGYNPLTVAATLFHIPSDDVDSLVGDLQISKLSHQEAARKILSQSFRPGQLLKDLEAAGVVMGMDREAAVHIIITNAKQISAAQYAQNGFWADHWTYTLDLVKSFTSVFPDKEEEMLWDSAKIPFFLSPSVVKPRSSRYTLVDDAHRPGKKTVRIYNAVSQWGEVDFPPARHKALMTIFKDPNYVSSADGTAGVWQQTAQEKTFKVAPVTKLAMLALLKFSTLDPQGMGVEMEGGKPGWNDAMNGLPGIIGSGMAETYELLLIIRYVRNVVHQYRRSVSFPKEFSDLLDGLSTALGEYEASDRTLADDFTYWDTSNNLRELYREETMAVFDGTMIEWSAKHMVSFLDTVESKTVAGIARALNTNKGLSPTFFHYECMDYTVVENVSTSTKVVTAKKFELRTLPLFLEGPVRYLKTVDGVELKREVYANTKASEMYDTELKMFKISGSLKNMQQDIGRMMAFSPGWLENESVWLHMSYKFYLELLRGNLFDAFYLEISTGLVPFMAADVYGRSPLEAASFIVSSVFPDEKLHGASFLARLSGSTAEFLSMWELIMQGSNPFLVNEDGELILSLAPALASWLFRKEDATVSFMFLGACRVTYHNPLFQDTWNMRAERYELVMLDGTTHTEEGLVIGPEMAIAARNLQVRSIDVFFEN